MKTKKKKYGTEAQKIKTLKKRGNIITFKEPFSWKGEQFMQIMVQGIENLQLQHNLEIGCACI